MGVDEERLVIEETFHIPVTVVHNATKEILHTMAYIGLNLLLYKL